MLHDRLLFIFKTWWKIFLSFISFNFIQFYFVFLLMKNARASKKASGAWNRRDECKRLLIPGSNISLTTLFQFFHPSSSLPCDFTTIIRRWLGLFSHLLNLVWPLDVVWLTECVRSESESVLVWVSGTSHIHALSWEYPSTLGKVPSQVARGWACTYSRAHLS